ncbi:ER lumen protein-retaining receptor 2 [Carlito syrichta]|uniref:ER lumen protein-retaining receptor n=1 Tax=Carlito syrichta TaxID=1868482 RepID=A0A3Q0EJV7_CARSF|nr:ER lumen protein-retaining receptor 2 [Carlito syrichta]
MRPQLPQPPSSGRALLHPPSFHPGLGPSSPESGWHGRLHREDRGRRAAPSALCTGSLANSQALPGCREPWGELRSGHSPGTVSASAPWLLGPRKDVRASFLSLVLVGPRAEADVLAHKTETVAKPKLGISGKSQLLYALVFTTRYLDLFTSFVSLYNTFMKLIYVACSYATVYLIYMKFKATYDGNHDTFRVEFLVVPVGGLSFLVNHDFSPLEILWTFSIYLESVAILPQLFMISKTGEAETITTHYLFFLGIYRALYLINWIWRFYFEGFFDLIAVVAGVVQTILYCDFFYLYITKVLKGKKLSLPA